MPKIPAIPLVLAFTFLLGSGTAIAVSWPSTATTLTDVNAHLNALHATAGTQFSKIKVVQGVATASGGNSQSAQVGCPAHWVATGFGFSNEDSEWYPYNAFPTFPMGPKQVKPIGYSASFSDPTYDGEAFPTITLFVICAT
jgi:hypothetical protein